MKSINEGVDFTDLKRWTMPKAVANLSASYAFTDTDGIGDVYITTGTNWLTFTLPAAANNIGRTIRFMKIDSAVGAFILKGFGSELINDNNYYINSMRGHGGISAQYFGNTVRSNGVSWIIVEHSEPAPRCYEANSTTFLDAAVNTGTDTITINAHGYHLNMPIMFTNSGGALPGGIAAGTIYYILNPTLNTFQLSTGIGGAVNDITSAAGGGTHTTYPYINPATSTATVSSVIRVSITLYQEIDGDWRAILNACVSCNSTARTAFTVAMNGIVFKNVANFNQAIAANQNGSKISQGTCAPNTGNITCDHGNTSATNYYYSGDVELDAKPAWYN